MKYHKFEKIQKGSDPIIRVTYKNWRGKLIVKDVYKHKTLEDFWLFMENDQPTHHFGPITNFHNNHLDVYYVNNDGNPTPQVKFVNVGRPY